MIKIMIYQFIKDNHFYVVFMKKNGNILFSTQINKEHAKMLIIEYELNNKKDLQTHIVNY